MSINQFLKECNKKEVFKKLSIYVVTSWILIQVLAVTWEPLGLPKKSVTILLIILLIGFPINVYLVWKYHLAALEVKKIKLDENGDPIKIKSKKSSFKKMYFTLLAVISSLSLFSSILIVNTNFISTINLNSVVESDKIAVLQFGNNTGREEFNTVGKMAADWIIHGITENEVGQVVSPEIVENYAEIFKTSLISSAGNHEKILKDYFKPSKIITGNFYLKDDKLLFQSTIKDGLLNETLISFKVVECNSENPIECLEKMKQLILGYLVTEANQQLNLQESPPKFEAYKYVLDAKVNDKDNSKGESKFLEYLNEAIKIDSNYFEPKLLRIGHFYNKGEFKIADSLRKVIPITSNRNERQRNLLNLYESLLEGNYAKSYSFIKKEYNLAPFDIESNASAMTIALQYVNKPEDVEEIYNEISMKDMDIGTCQSCKYRVYIKALAGIELKKYKEVIDFLENLTETIDDIKLKRTLSTAYVRKGNLTELKNLVDKIKLTSTSNSSDWEDMCFFVGKEFLLNRNTKMANEYFNRIIGENSQNLNMALAFYFKKDYRQAELILEKLYNSNVNDNNILTKLAIVYYKNGNKLKSQQAIEKLKSNFKEYQFGEIDYYLAQFFAAINDKENSINYLLKSVAHGFSYTADSFQNDPHFLEYKNSKEFIKILSFWH